MQNKPPSCTIQRAVALGVADYFAELSTRMGRAYHAEGDRIEAQVERVKHLKRTGHYEDALGFLLAELDLQEADSRNLENWVVAPWYYEQAAIVCRKLKRYDAEVAILDRYFRQNIQLFSPRTKAMIARLEKAKTLRDRDL